MKKLLLLSFVLALLYPLRAQVTTDPAIPTQSVAVTVIFNATGTPLEGYSGDLYAHTGVTIEGTGRWQHVIESWGNNTTQPQLTNIGVDLYELEITPSINDYYGVDAGEVVTELCFVFRSADSGTQSSDIFIDVFQSGLAIAISSPTAQPYFVDASSSFDLQIDGAEATSTVVKIDGSTVHTETVSPNSFSYSVTAAASGTHEIVVEATDGSETVSDNFFYVTRATPTVATLPAGVKDGINYIDDNTVTLVLHAPYKEYVYVFGSFNDWAPEIMNRTDANINDETLRYWITITGLNAGQEYVFQYLIDEELKIADPYAEKILDPWNDGYIDNETYPNLIAYPNNKTDGIASVFQTAQTPFNWQVADFTPPKKEDLVIYELLVRDFAADANYQTLIDTVGYFKRLGVNAIELMPINEFDGNSSWGYNPAFYFAPDKAYGTKNKLKEFIDVCHQNNIAVFIDLVLNHSYGQSPFVRMYWDDVNSKPSSQNLWYNTDHNFQNPDAQWGYDFNHESDYTKALVDSINSFWMSEYKVDGFRFDFTKGFSNTVYGPSDWGSAYDAARIAILKRMADEIWARNPDAYVSFEHLADNSEEKELANYGIYLWGNLNYNYSEAAMGYVDNSDLSWGYYANRTWNDPTLVTYMESHDEERTMYRLLNYGKATSYYNTKEKATALRRVELAATFFFTIPGPKMIWQFEELGYDVSIDDPGRVDPKPIKWDYYDDEERYRLFQVFAALIDLKKEQDVFENGTVNMSVSGNVKRINISSPDMDVTIIGNFDVSGKTIDPNFQQTGSWYDYFTGESIDVTDVNAEITLSPGEYHIYTTVQLETPDITDPTTSIHEVNGKNNINIGLKTYPNPTTDRVKVEFSLENTVENAEIAVFNLNGQKVHTLYSGKLLEGQHSLDWNVNNKQGNKVSKGLYLLKIEATNINQNSVIVVN
jgi:glycosidase